LRGRKGVGQLGRGRRSFCLLERVSQVCTRALITRKRKLEKRIVEGRGNSIPQGEGKPTYAAHLMTAPEEGGKAFPFFAKRGEGDGQGGANSGEEKKAAQLVRKRGNAEEK